MVGVRTPGPPLDPRMTTTTIIGFFVYFRSGIWSMCVILPLVGVTWVMGVFSVNEELVVFQYIFALVNSLQVIINPQKTNGIFHNI